MTQTAPLPPRSIAYLGPVGTYGEQASRRLAGLAAAPEAELLAQISIRNVVLALVAGRCGAAVVPVENSVEGGVSTCLDVLWESSLGQQEPLWIERSLVLPIRHALLSEGELPTISEVLSHPQALGQCSLWLQEHLPAALQLPTSSTAEAARLVKGSRFRAAIASLAAGQEHGLPVRAYPINDQPGNCTRFLLLRRGPAPLGSGDSSGGECTSLAFSLRGNVPGGLMQALQVFASRQLNMSRIESRPSKRELGEYVFFVDLETAGQGALLTEALGALAPLCEHLACFGSYPITDDTIEL
ncbi:MAG: Prephenate dehydratase [Cyanobacteriota bacterium]|jgi:prephenate dehydratase